MIRTRNKNLLTAATVACLLAHSSLGHAGVGEMFARLKKAFPKSAKTAPQEEAVKAETEAAQTVNSADSAQAVNAAVDAESPIFSNIELKSSLVGTQKINAKFSNLIRCLRQDTCNLKKSEQVTNALTRRSFVKEFPFLSEAKVEDLGFEAYFNNLSRRYPSGILITASKAKILVSKQQAKWQLTDRGNELVDKFLFPSAQFFLKDPQALFSGFEGSNYFKVLESTDFSEIYAQLALVRKAIRYGVQIEKTKDRVLGMSSEFKSDLLGLLPHLRRAEQLLLTHATHLALKSKSDLGPKYAERLFLINELLESGRPDAQAFAGQYLTYLKHFAYEQKLVHELGMVQGFEVLASPQALEFHTKKLFQWARKAPDKFELIALGRLEETIAQTKKTISTLAQIQSDAFHVFAFIQDFEKVGGTFRRLEQPLPRFLKKNKSIDPIANYSRAVAAVFINFNLKADRILSTRYAEQLHKPTQEIRTLAFESCISLALNARQQDKLQFVDLAMEIGRTQPWLFDESVVFRHAQDELKDPEIITAWQILTSEYM